MALVNMTERTVLTKATSKSESLRTTVPRWIVKHFDLRERDLLEWKLEVQGSKLRIEVRPLKKNAPIPPEMPAVRRQRTLATKPSAKIEADNASESRKRWRLR
jgi:hypothetical protein